MWPDLLSAAVSGSFVIVSMMYQSRRHRPRPVGFDFCWSLILPACFEAFIWLSPDFYDLDQLGRTSCTGTVLMTTTGGWRFIRQNCQISGMFRRSEGLRLMIINQRWSSSTTTSSPHDGAAWLAISRLAPYAAHDLWLLIICSLLLLIICSLIIYNLPSKDISFSS